MLRTGNKRANSVVGRCCLLTKYNVSNYQIRVLIMQTHHTEIHVNEMYVNITCQKFALISLHVNFVRVVNMLHYIPMIRYLLLNIEKDERGGGGGKNSNLNIN